MNTMAKVWKLKNLCSWDTLWHFQFQGKLLLVSFQGAEHNGKGLKALAITISDILYNIFTNTHFCLESWLPVIPRAPEMATSKVFRGAEHNGKDLKTVAILCFWDTLWSFSQNSCFRVESGFLSFLDVFMGAEHNEKGLKALAITISEILYSIFTKHIFA